MILLVLDHADCVLPELVAMIYEHSVCYLSTDLEVKVQFYHENPELNHGVN